MSLIAPEPSGPPRMAEPARVLLLTAPVGEGHNTAATAIAELLRTARPACAVRVLDSFPARAGERERRRYQLAVQVFPLGYELWYRAVASWDWCHRYYRRLVGARVGRRLRAEIARFSPDVVLSTYPLATAGVAWLRRIGRLEVPVLAFLSDFAPHRFWVYPGVDEYLVLSERGRVAMRQLAPEAPVRVCRPAVDTAFRPPSTGRVVGARERFGLPADGMVVLVSTGAMAMGSVRRTVRAVRASGAHVVVAVGRNQRLGRSLRRGNPESAVTVLDWTDDMAGLVAACDVVINNAGGATAAETLASGRALIMFRPISGHGRASAAMMAEAGVAGVCPDHRALRELLLGWVAEPRRLRAAQRRAEAYAGSHSGDETVAAVLEHAAALGRAGSAGIDLGGVGCGDVGAGEVDVDRIGALRR